MNSLHYSFSNIPASENFYIITKTATLAFSFTSSISWCSELGLMRSMMTWITFMTRF